MKVLIVLCLAIAAGSALPRAAFRAQWTSYKSAHGKQYSNPMEDYHRMAIFRQRLVEIEEHNARYALGEETYSQGINQFSDWTTEEFLEYVNLGKLTKPATNKRIPRFSFQPKGPTAATIDWRSKAVGKVKNQGQCGSCWSFSATGALEGQLALHKGGLVSLSEQNLMDCSSSYGNAGCNGGWMDSAFKYINEHGIMSEKDYPYEAKSGKCRFEKAKSVTNIKSYHDIKSGSEADLATALSNHGPISVAIDATAKLQSYAGGIIHDTTCNAQDLNHGVLAVGYGTEGGKDYWIVKNSWGAGWGEGGYYRTVRNAKNNCGIATAASYPTI